jgi:hypothetical protein
LWPAAVESILALIQGQSNMPRKPAVGSRKEPALPEIESLRGYIGQLPQAWREKMFPLCDRVEQYIELQNKLLRMAHETVEQLQLDLKYMTFDIEATRRERDQLMRELGIDGGGEAETE